MFKEMRRNDREISLAEAEEILKKCSYGTLSTIGEDGYPYGVPVSYAYADGKIYFHCAKGVGHKVENMEYNNKVCFSVVGDTETLPEKFSTKYESAIVFGTAKPAEDVKGALMKLIEKYSPDYLESGTEYVNSSWERTGVYEITAQRITGKARR